MGEAKRKQAELATWVSSLPEDERKIFEVSYATFNDIIAPNKLTSRCYLISFFLTEYLRERHDVIVEPVVGYVTDERDDLPISHAWVEFNGKIIDLTLFYTETQPRGAVLVLDRAVKGGEIGYTYHRDMTAASRASLEHLQQMNPEARAMIEHKKREHAIAAAANVSTASRMAFLNDAPDDRNYETMCLYLDSI